MGQNQPIRWGTVIPIAIFSLLIALLYTAERLWPRCVAKEKADSLQFRKEQEHVESIDDSGYYKRAEKPLPKCVTDKNGNIVQAKSFIMVFQSRSGSTTISQTMQQHPLIQHEFELLDREKIPEHDGETAINITRAFFKKIISQGKIPGYKIRSYHVLANVQGWRDLVKEFDTRVIWQYRKNLMKVGIGTYARIVLGDNSKAAGFNSKEIEGKNQCDLGAGCSFRIEDWVEFHKILTSRIANDVDMIKAAHILDAGRQCIFELPYEDYLYYQNDTITNLWKFLGIHSWKYDLYLTKATGDNMCKVIENFDELCEKFYGCPIWQPYLDDFHNHCRCVNFTYGETTFCSMYNYEQIARFRKGEQF